MKKRNNKTIVLIVIGIFFVVLFGIFILNYSKDNASFSILEKKWISVYINAKVLLMDTNIRKWQSIFQKECIGYL